MLPPQPCDHLAGVFLSGFSAHHVLRHSPIMVSPHIALISSDDGELHKLQPVRFLSRIADNAPAGYFTPSVCRDIIVYSLVCQDLYVWPKDCGLCKLFLREPEIKEANLNPGYQFFTINHQFHFYP